MRSWGVLGAEDGGEGEVDTTEGWLVAGSKGSGKTEASRAGGYSGGSKGTGGEGRSGTAIGRGSRTTGGSNGPRVTSAAVWSDDSEGQRKEVAARRRGSEGAGVGGREAVL